MSAPDAVTAWIRTHGSSRADTAGALANGTFRSGFAPGQTGGGQRREECIREVQ